MPENESGPTAGQVANAVDSTLKVVSGVEEAVDARTAQQTELGAGHAAQGVVDATKGVVGEIPYIGPSVVKGLDRADGAVNNYVAENTPAGTPQIGGVGGVAGALNEGAKHVGQAAGQWVYDHAPPEKVEKAINAVEKEAGKVIDTLENAGHSLMKDVGRGLGLEGGNNLRC